jgi:hypothetical protein
MSARRCSTCGVNWPTDWKYRECAHCGGTTDHISNADPIPEDEAKRTLHHLKFDAFYAARGERPVEVDFSYLDEIAALAAIPVKGDPIPVPPLPPELWGSEAHRLRRS